MAIELFWGKRGAVFGLALLSAAAAAYMARNALHVNAPAPAQHMPIMKVETVGVLVARSDIPLGKRIGAEDLEWVQWPIKDAEQQFIRQNSRAGAIAQLTGSLARASFVKGEPIAESKLARGEGSGYLASLLGPGMRAVSIEIVPNNSVNGFIMPNDHVDVLVTSAEKRYGSDFYTGETVLSDIQVLAIDNKVGGTNAGTTMPGKMATLALTPQQVQKLAVSQRLGSLSLILRSSSDNSNSFTPDGTSDRAACDSRIGERQSVSVIRYGIESNSVSAKPSC